MDGQNRQTPGPSGRFLGRSSSFSSSSNRASVPTPPPLSISRPNLIPHHWPPSHPGSTACTATDADPDSSDPPASACRRGQLAFFDRECSRVEDHLYLGSDLVARDRDALRRHSITHILNCVGGPELFSPEITYKTLWLADNPSQDITSVLYDVFDYFEDVRCGGAGAGGPRSRRVLVHCSRGVSRSAALVVAYLMWRHSLQFDTALRRVRAARPVSDPNLGFASQLLTFQSRILASPSSCSSSSSRCRLYRMAPQSPYDPLHLVPKPVDRRAPTPADLDSRGAFVVHVPSSSRVYVWVGRDCDPTLQNSAVSAAWQIVRYENAAGPILTVNDGSETADFWDSFGDLDKGDNEQEELRRVSSYDLDFEIFGRAIKGGVVPPFQPAPSQPGSPTRLPSKEGGWGKLRQRLLAGGVRELVTCCRLPASSDERDLEPFGSPQSAVSPDLSTSPDFSTLSPGSTNSDWCNSSSPGSEICYDGEFLLPIKSSLPGDKLSPSSPHEQVEELEEPESVKDWLFSPFRLSLEDDTSVLDNDSTSPTTDGDIPFMDGHNDFDGCMQPIEPALFRWPSTEKVENMNPSVLDSSAVFLLLAPELSSRKKGSKVLYVWVGGQCQVANENDDNDDKADGHEKLRKIGREFLRKMSYSGDIRIQVTREDEEPPQFLNHLFTFDQAKDVNKS